MKNKMIKRPFTPQEKLYWDKVQSISDLLYQYIDTYEKSKVFDKAFDCWDIAEKIIRLSNRIEKEFQEKIPLYQKGHEIKVDSVS